MRPTWDEKRILPFLHIGCHHSVVFTRGCYWNTYIWYKTNLKLVITYPLFVRKNKEKEDKENKSLSSTNIHHPYFI